MKLQRLRIENYRGLKELDSVIDDTLRSAAATPPDGARAADAVLKATAKRPMPNDPMLAIAGLGGHLPRNGDPGGLVLGRGMHDLLLLELGWSARERVEK